MPPLPDEVATSWSERRLYQRIGTVLTSLRGGTVQQKWWRWCRSVAGQRRRGGRAPIATESEEHQLISHCRLRPRPYGGEPEVGGLARSGQSIGCPPLMSAGAIGITGAPVMSDKDASKACESSKTPTCSPSCLCTAEPRPCPARGVGHTMSVVEFSRSHIRPIRPLFHSPTIHFTGSINLSLSMNSQPSAPA